MNTCSNDRNSLPSFGDAVAPPSLPKRADYPSRRKVDALAPSSLAVYMRRISRNVDPKTSFENKAKMFSNVAKVFNIFAHPDAMDGQLYSFVFRKDPSEDLQILSDADALQFAAPMSITDCEWDIGYGTANPPDKNVVTDLLYFPAGCHGCFSFGTICRTSCVTDKKSTDAAALDDSPPTAAAVHDVSTFRFCRNEANGDFLVVSEDPAGTLTNVMFKSNTSTTRSLHIRLSVRSAYLRGGYQNGASAEKLVCAVRDARVVEQTRACPMCRAGAMAQCACAIAYVPVRHTKDFSAVLMNSVHVVGTFNGEAVYTTHNCRVDRYVTAKTMSVTQAAARLNIMLPESLRSTAVRMLVAAAHPRALEMSDTRNQRCISTEPTQGTTTWSAGPNDPARDTALGAPAMVDGTKMEMETRDKPIFALDAVGQDHTEEGQNCGMGDMSKVVGGISVRTAATGTEAVTGFIAEPEGDVLSCRSPPRLDDGTMHAARDDVGNTAAPFASRQLQRSDGTSGNLRAQRTRTLDERERTRRKELRRQKNRAAAARSNARRKEHYLNLGRDLERIRDRAEVLRARLKVLREENVYLRKLTRT